MPHEISANMDPQLARVLSTMPVVDLSDVQKIRALNQNTRMPMTNTSVEILVEDRTISHPGGPDVRVRVCRPAAARGPLPGILYCHPGLSFGTLDMDHARCARFAAEVYCEVVSVDYRLAPENPFPAGLEDCYAALGWMKANRPDGARLAVAGCSTGATLAAALALMARDRGAPRLALQLLLCPATDDRLLTESMARFAEPGPMEAGRVGAEFLWRYYLGGASRSAVSGYAAPARAADLRGLAPAYVTTAEFDCVRDEGMEYALKLLRAGVPTELHHYSGCFHAFDLVARTAAVSIRAVDEQVTVLRRALGSSRPRDEA